MKTTIITNNGKKLEIPSRMFRTIDLEDMEVSYVKDKLFLNLNKNEELELPSEEINKNMVVVDYVDCSDKTFSIKKLQRVVDKSLKSNGDFIVLPYFKNENEFDIRTKLKLAKSIRKDTSKEIIIEISYKSTISLTELKNIEDDFDYISIFYGTHFGRLPSFTKICEKVMEIKVMLRKKVFCSGVPLMFSGNTTDYSSYLLPIWDFISDGWIKNWRRGGGKNQIKLIDLKDYQNKTRIEWLENGHRPNEIIQQVDTTVQALFSESKEGEQLRESYTKQIIGEAILEVSFLNINESQRYIIERVRPLYRPFVLELYREKIIQHYLLSSDWINNFSDDDQKLIEKVFRQNLFMPFDVFTKVKEINQLIEEENKITTEQIIKIVSPEY